MKMILDKRFVALNTLVLPHNRVDHGYWWNLQDEQLYSSKSTADGSLRKLNGSRIAGVIRYNLKTTSRWNVIVRKDTIATAAKKLSKTVLEQARKVKAEVPWDESWGGVDELDEAKPAVKGWIIGTVRDGNYSIVSRPKIHLTEVAANLEIERLAKLHVGCIYVKMKIESYAQAGGINIW